MFGGENCIALLDEHDVAAMLTNDLGILGRLLGYAQSGRFGAVYLLLRGDCNILCFFLCGVIQIGFPPFFDVPAAGSVGDTPQVRAILHARSIVEASPPSE